MKKNFKTQILFFLFLFLFPYISFAENDLEYISSLEKKIKSQMLVKEDSSGKDLSQKEAGKNVTPSVKLQDNETESLSSQFSTLSVPDHKTIDFFVDYYTSLGKEKLQRSLQRFASLYPIISKYATKYNVPLELSLLGFLESDFYPGSLSQDGGKGLWNIKPYTAKIYNLTMNDYLDERMDIDRSTDVFFQYLARLKDSFNGNWDLAIAAYNGGGNYINAQLRKYKTVNFWDIIDKDASFQDDSLEYVPRFYAILKILKRPSHYNIEMPVFSKNQQFAKITISKTGVPFKDISKRTNVTLKELMELNPQLHKQFTIKNANLYIPSRLERLMSRRISVARVYRLKWIPSGANISMPETSYRTAKRTTRHHSSHTKTTRTRPTATSTSSTKTLAYKVKKGDTLYGIARHYGLTLSQIQKMNHLKNVVKVGQTIKVSYVNEKPVSSKKASSTKSKNIYYTVKAGDTLYGIANKYHVAANKVYSKHGQQIQKGDVLRIVS